MKALTRLVRTSLFFALVVACVAPAMAQSHLRKLGPQNLYRYWILLNTSVKMDAPNAGLNLDKPGCVAVTYEVGSNGKPLDVQVAKMVPKSDLGAMAVSAVRDFRYGPSLTNRDGEPISTYYIVPFNAPPDKAQRQTLMDRCKLPGYGA